MHVDRRVAGMEYTEVMYGCTFNALLQMWITCGLPVDYLWTNHKNVTGLLLLEKCSNAWSHVDAPPPPQRGSIEKLRAQGHGPGCKDGS